MLSQRSVQSLHNGSRGLYRLVQVVGVEAGSGSISFLSCENRVLMFEKRKVGQIVRKEREKRIR